MRLDGVRQIVDAIEYTPTHVVSPVDRLGLTSANQELPSCSLGPCRLFPESSFSRPPSHCHGVSLAQHQYADVY